MEGLIKEGVGDLAGFASGHISSALAGGDAHFFEDIPSSPAKIRELLESSQEPEKLKGMKWLLAMLSKGNTVAEFFPDVVKNVAVKSIEVKKMVYIYLVHYADFNDYCREIALLSINSFQKDLAGTNQLIRGLALRVMTSIRVPDIIQLQTLAVRKCSTDGSPYVRRCAAVALAKIHILDPSQDDELIDILEKLLGDSSTMVLGSAVAALVEIDPTRFDIMHPCFRKLCQLLADLDEWTQVAVLGMMKRYVRDQFTDPHRGRRYAPTAAGPADASGPSLRPAPAPLLERGFYSDDSDSDNGREKGKPKASSWGVSDSKANAKPEQGSVFVGKEVSIDYDNTLDADHRLVLSASLALLKSRNSAVVLAACSLHFYCGVIEPNSATTVRIAKAMVRVLRSRREIQFAILTSIKSMVIEAPWMFLDYFQEFYIKSDDPIFNRLLKLDILTALCIKDNSVALCKELQAYVKETNPSFVVASVQAVAKVAERNTDLLATVLSGLATLLTCHRHLDVHAACAAALRHLLQIGFSLSASAPADGAVPMDFLEDKDDKKRSKKSKKHKHKDAAASEDGQAMRQLREHCEGVLRQVLRLLFVPENAVAAPVARANLIWLAGEYYSVFQLIAKDLLRLLAVDFKNEEPCTKKEILTMAVKFSMRCPSDAEMEDLMTYVLELSRYDVSTDVRDLARLMTAVCGLASGDDTGDILSGEGGGVNADALEDLSERASRIMLATKKPPKIVLNSAHSVSAAAMWDGNDTVSKMLFLIDSVSALTGYRVPGYTALSPWAEKQPDSSVRDKVVGSSIDAMDRGYASNAADDKPWLSSTSKRMDDANFYDDDNDSIDSGKNRSSHKHKSSRRDSSSSESSTSATSDSSDSGSDSDSSAPGQRAPPRGGNRHIMDPRSTSCSESGSSSSDSEDSDEPPPRRSAVASAKPMAPADMDALSGGVARRAGVRKVVGAGGGSASPADAHAAHSGRSPHPGGAVNLLDDVYDYSPAQVGGGAAQRRSAQESSDMSFLESMGPSAGQQDVFGMPEAIPQPPAPMTPPAASDSNILAQILDSFPAVQVSGDAATPAGLPASASSVSPTARTSAPDPSMPEVRGLPKVLLNPDLSAGLSIALEFRHGIKPSMIQGTGAKCGFLTFKNCGQDYAIRRIKLGLPRDVKHTPVQEISLLSPNESVVVPIEIMTAGITGSAVKFDVRSDRGTYKASLPFESFDGITPVVCSVDQFEGLKRQLRGFSESTVTGCRVASGGRGDLLGVAIASLRSVVDMYVLPSDGDTARLSGSCVLKGPRTAAPKESTVLVTVMKDSGSPGCVSIVVNCEDTVLNSSLSGFLKKSIMNS